MKFSRTEITELKGVEGEKIPVAWVKLVRHNFILPDDYISIALTDSVKLDLFLPEIQQYATFPLAREVYGSLLGKKVATFPHIPEVGAPLPKNIHPDWVGKFIIIYGSAYKIVDTDIYGFLAFSFDESGEVKQYFVPQHAKLRSVHYALIMK